jgi:tRNA (cmo5U34)-methyltransferase
MRTLMRRREAPIHDRPDTARQGDGAAMDRALDRLFNAPNTGNKDFNFGPETTNVFDDMVDRSVPYYAEIQRMVAELAADFSADGSNLYDMGCATGTTLVHVHKALPADRKLKFIGLDNSPAMLDKAKEMLARSGFNHECELRCADLNKPIDVENASVVIFNLTLQFIRPLHRDRLIETVYRGMNPNGCLILVEKVLGENSTFNRLFIQHYYEMKKRHGYTEMEIAQKREALENVLIPYRLKENEELLQRAGFQHIDVFFKWYNFCGIVAAK